MQIQTPIESLLGKLVRHRKDGGVYRVGTEIKTQPVVLLYAEQHDTNSSYRSVEQVLRDYRLVREREV